MNLPQPPNADKNLDEVVVAYLEAIENGQPPDREEWLDRYPHLAPQLSEFFADQDRFGRLAGSLREAVSPIQETAIEEKLSESGRLGDFRILRQVGRGGMGIVYEAEQVSLGRRVALKVLPFASTLDAKQLQRFKNEARAAAQLHHTNIVPVHATGCERGVHYYAMQFIDGQTLAALIRQLRQVAGLEKEEGEEKRESEAPAEFVGELLSGKWAPAKPSDANSQGATIPAETAAYSSGREGKEHFPSALPADTPLPAVISTEHSSKNSAFFRTLANLGVQAAEALEHAHQVGIIHRDIKPGNLLVDGRGNLWITDFGLALCQSQAGLTMTGDLIGTLRYMSPEQALAKRVLVDHRTDIYSLGATLHELLTLEPPFRGSDRQELLRQIAFEEPRPLRRINKSIPPELETIVLKSLEKAPHERYATAQELADDLRRFLQHEPILAKKPTWIQRANKWSRRHPAVTRSAIVVLFLITAGSLLSAWLIWREKEQTRIQRDLAESNEKLAKEQSERAESEKQIAQAVRDFLKTKLLRQTDTYRQADALLMTGRPAADAKLNPTIGELLDRAATELAPDKIERQFPKQPLVQAEILQLIGDTYHGIGAYGPAIAHLERARDLRQRELARDHPDLLDTLNNLAVAYEAAGRLPEAIRLLEQVRDIQVEKLGADHPANLTRLANLGRAYQAAGRLPEAIRLLEQVRDMQDQKFAADHPHTPNTLSHLATAYQAAGRLAEAIALYEQVRDQQMQKLGPDHPATMYTLANLGMAYQAAGRLPEAIRLLQQVPDKLGEKLGPDHPETLKALNNLAAAYKAAGRLPEAIRLLEGVRGKLGEKLGPDHPETLKALNNLAAAYKGAGRLPEAIRLLEEVRGKLGEKLSPDHPQTLIALNNLAAAYQDAGKLPEAIALYEQVRDQQIRKLGPDHPATLNTLGNLGTVYQAAGRLSEAIALYQQVRDKQVERLGPDHPATLNTLNNLASAYWLAMQLDRSVPLFEQLLEKDKVKLGVNHPLTLVAMANLAVNYRDADRLTEAVPLLEEALSRVRKLPDPKPAKVMWIPGAMAETYNQGGQFAKAEPLYREVLDQARKQFGPDHPQTGDALAQLAWNLLRQNKSADAEPVLRECLAIREKKEPDAWITFNTKSMLGGALLAQKKYAEAEPLLVQGYEGLKQRQAKIPPQGKARLSEALERLVELYEANGQKDQAAQWRQKRADLKKDE